MSTAGLSSAKATIEVTRPFAVTPLLAYLGARAINGVEQVTAATYRRVILSGGEPGVLTVDLSSTVADGQVRISCVPALAHTPDSLVRLATKLLDAKAPVDLINPTLTRDSVLAPLVRRNPGLRIPGTVAPFELAARAILGQQVSVSAASTFAAKLAANWGSPLQRPAEGLCRAFPDADFLVDAPMESVGVTRGRATAIRSLARAVLEGSLSLDIDSGGLEAAEASLLTIPGIGPWTVGYIALRGLGDRDAIPASDLGLRQALGAEAIMSAVHVAERAESWRPWRGYGAVHLWSTYLK
jgi:AraC family transcriptional regulator of adaptative response / DNA-3-methyladenine glycosylase II